MYKQFFHLQSNPFNNNPDPRFLYVMPQTREALACLEHGISARKGFVVLTGEVGTGKTTLLRRAIECFDPAKVFTAFVFNFQFDSEGLLEFILSDLGIIPESRSKSGMLIQFNRWLIERYRRDETCVLVIDEAQNLSFELLEEIRLLTNLETTSEKLVQIVLAGQPELEDKLRQPMLRQLRQRIAMWCRTTPLMAKQTEKYVAERLRIAGTTEAIFLPDALKAIHMASSGIPRVVNLLCEHALITAYAEDRHQIDAALIEDVARDLGLGRQGPNPAASQA